MDKVELLGGACFSHGPYTFYKAVRIGNGRVLRLGSFFLTKLWTDADLVSIGELQLLWLDSRGSNQPLASLRLYFLPENTPDGRRNTHGEDEVLTISEKVVVRVHDLVTWLSPSVEWSWGREVSFNVTPRTTTPETESKQKNEANYPQILTDPGIDFTDVDKQQKEYETNVENTIKPDEKDTKKLQTRVVVLSYPRYCRYRALLRRLQGAEPSWLCTSIAAALGGFTALPGTKVLFCRDTFDYPDLETHELLCNHLAPKLKGRPRRKRKKRSVSPGESSNESEASVASTSRGAVSNLSLVPASQPPSGVRRSERKTTGEEKKFLTDVHSFMRLRGTPVGKMPLLGYRQIDLFLFYTKVQKLGGYDTVSGGRLWKSIYDDIGGNVGSTSAATITRRHYERLLLPYERHQRGEETKVRPAHGRRMKCGSLSRDSVESKPEAGNISTSGTPSPPEAPTVVSPVPPLPSILSSSPFLPGDKPKTEGVKTSSLRSVRVKPERLKSLNTIIANSSTQVVVQNSQLPSPSPPPSSNASTSSTPSNTPSTTPTMPSCIVDAPTSGVSTSSFPTSPFPISGVSTSPFPTSGVSTSSFPTSGAPTSPFPTSGVPTSSFPTSGVPTSGVPTSPFSTSGAPTSSFPTSGVPTSSFPTSGVPTSGVPTFGDPTSGVPTSLTQSVLERQLNTPMMNQLPPQSSSSSSSSPCPITSITTNSTTTTTTTTTTTMIVTLTPPPEKDTRDGKHDGHLQNSQKSTTMTIPQGKENIPIYDEKRGFGMEKMIDPPPLSLSPEIIDLETESDSSREKIVIPSFKKRKLEILREGGLEVTAVDLEARPSVIKATLSPITSPLTSGGGGGGTPVKNDETSSDPGAVAVTSVPTKLISVTVTPDIGHILPASNDQQTENGNCQNSSFHPRLSTVKSLPNNHNNAPPPPPPPPQQTNNSRVINVGSPNADLLQLYANATTNTSAVRPTPSPSPPVNHRYVTASPTNDRQAPPKVTQSRSIFGHCERTVYGNPKDILARHNYNPMKTLIEQRSKVDGGGTSSSSGNGNNNNNNNSSGSNGGDILDLTQQRHAERAFARPNLEIVRVPVVPRANPLNLEMKNPPARITQETMRKATFPGYPGMLDSRTMATNNLEITLVSPKNRNQTEMTQQQQQQQQIRKLTPSPPASRQQNSNNCLSNGANVCNNGVGHGVNGNQHKRHQNGKYSSRSEPVSPYATRKPSHQAIIPNIPNLQRLGNYGASRTTTIHHQQQQQQIFNDRRKTSGNETTSHDRTTNNHNNNHNNNHHNNHHHHENHHHHHNNHHRRTSEGDKTSIARQQMPKIHTARQIGDTSRRQNSSTNSSANSTANSTANYTGNVAGSAGVLPQNSSPNYLAQLPNNNATASKFLPILDPLYYSAFYNGLFPPPIPAATAAAAAAATSQPYVPPEFNAYYKELLASTSQPRLAMGGGQHQPAVPTSK